MFKKRIVAILTVACIVFALSSCYKINTTEKGAYTSFYKEMKKREHSICEFFPAPEYSNRIEDLYLNYADAPFDSLYACYLLCRYTPEEYEAEKQRFSAVAKSLEEYIEPVTDPNMFSRDYILAERNWDIQMDNAFDEIYYSVNYAYVLLDEPNNTMVYVALYDLCFDIDYTRIPAGYLPADLIEIRQQIRNGTLPSTAYTS